jgi:hypothetical protein
VRERSRRRTGRDRSSDRLLAPTSIASRRFRLRPEVLMRRSQTVDARCWMGRARPATSADPALTTTVGYCTPPADTGVDGRTRRARQTRRTAPRLCVLRKLDLSAEQSETSSSV